MKSVELEQSVGVVVRFHMVGYLFTYPSGTGRSRVRIEMWREDATTGQRYWITVAACAPNPASARSVARALVAWVKSCDIGPRRDVQSTAVAESFAMLREYIAQNAPGARGSVHARAAATLTRQGEFDEIHDVAL